MMLLMVIVIVVDVAAELQEVLNTLSAAQRDQLNSRLTSAEREQLVTPTLLATAQLNALCSTIAAAYPPVATRLLAII